MTRPERYLKALDRVSRTLVYFTISAQEAVLQDAAMRTIADSDPDVTFRRYGDGTYTVIVPVFGSGDGFPDWYAANLLALRHVEGSE